MRKQYAEGGSDFSERFREWIDDRDFGHRIRDWREKDSWSFDRIRDWVSREDSDIDPNALSPFGYMGPKEDTSEDKFGKRFSDWRDRNKARREDRQKSGFRGPQKVSPRSKDESVDLRISRNTMLGRMSDAAGPQADRGLAEAEQNIREAKAAHRRVHYDEGGEVVDAEEEVVSPAAIYTDDPKIQKIIMVESSGLPDRESPLGAKGLMQIREETARQPGYGVTPFQGDDLFDPEENVRFGTEYYYALEKHFGSPLLAAIAYNMGPGKTNKWIEDGSNFEELPEETQGYVKKLGLE